MSAGFWRERTREVRQVVAEVLDEWDADSENDNYSKGEAADDLRHAMRDLCFCPGPPHDRRCPVRLARKESA